MHGTKPKPTHLKVVQGTKKKVRPKFIEAKPKPMLHDPPPFLKGEALKEWHRVAPMLHRIGLLTEADLSAISAYCQAYGHWRAAEDAFEQWTKMKGVIAGGYLTVSSKGQIIRNPLYNAARDAMHDVMRAAVELGMTPSARTRAAAAPPPPDEDDQAEQYFA